MARVVLFSYYKKRAISSAYQTPDDASLIKRWPRPPHPRGARLGSTSSTSAVDIEEPYATACGEEGRRPKARGTACARVDKRQKATEKTEIRLAEDLGVLGFLSALTGCSLERSTEYGGHP